MIFSYINLGEYEKAREIAEEMSGIYCTRDMLLPAATKDKEQELFLHQVNVVNFTDILINEIWRCVDFTDGPVEKQLELKLILEKVMLTVLGEDPCFYNERLYDISIATAWEYTKLKRYDEAMDTLEKTLQYAENFEERHTIGRYSVFWLDKLTSDPKAAVKNYEETLYDKMEVHLQNMCYHDGYYESNSRFNAIRKKVAAHRKG